MDDPLLWVAVGSATLSGFFSLNGYALRNVSRRDLEATFEDRPSRFLRPVREYLPQLQMVCALLRAVFNLMLLVALLGLFETARDNLFGIISAVSVAAVIISIFVIAIPHAWANYSAAKILATTAPILLALRWALWPVVAVMRAFNVPIRRLSGVPDPVSSAANNGNSNDDQSRLETAVKAEILQVASEGQAEGAVDDEEMEMIESVIEFGDQQAGEIITPRTDIVALPIDATPDQIRQTVNQAGHTRIPVYDGDIDNIVGILHAKDLLRIEQPEVAGLRQIMRKPFFVPETKRLDELLREFKARKSHMAVVLDEYGGTAGLITVEDLIEEIVGDISDEHDRPESVLIKRIDERTLEVDGRMHIDDLNDATGLRLPEDEDYDTLAGFVFSELGFIPPVGETLNAHGATFTVLAAEARKITRLRVEIPAPQKKAQ